ncbi:unnamed protein product [Trichobilharzia regenti]|nr:unnamed protein product [Trichobilharzia regenti]
MAIIDLYLYRPEMKTTPQLFCHNCENPLHHSELLSNPRWKKSSPIRVLSEYLSSGNRERIKNSNKCNNLDNCYHHYHRYQYHQFHNHDHRNDNINDINLKHTERMHSNHRSVLVNSNESSFQPVDLLTIHPENKNFELMKIKRIYGLIDYMLMSNHICCKHFESVQKFMNQLQAIVKPTEKDVDNKLRNLMNLSMHKFSEKVVAKGLKHLRNICKCPECNKNSQLGSEINEFTGETSYQYNNHNHNSVKFRKSEPQNSKSTKNKIKHPLDYRTTSFWTSCLSNTEVSDQELDRVDRSTSRSVCSPSNCTLLPSSSSLASYAYTSSSSVSSSSCSSSSLSLSPTSSPVTYSTCVSASSTSLKENEENEILTPDLICNCQKTHETGKFMKLGKLLKERKQTSAKNAEDVCEPRDGLVVKCVSL